MIFEVIKGYNEVDSRIINLPDGTKKEIFSQLMYMDKGGAFPEKMTVSVNSRVEAYACGHYTLCPTSFITNKFGGLELDRYNMKFKTHHITK